MPEEGLKASLARVIETVNDRFRSLTHSGVPILVVGDPQESEMDALKHQLMLINPDIELSGLPLFFLKCIIIVVSFVFLLE